MPAPDLHGTMTTDGDGTKLTFVRSLPHPVDAVWAAITEPERRALWIGPTVVDGRRGGIIETDPDDPPVAKGAKHMSGRILVWDPPRVLEHEWRQAIVEESIVRYELVPDGDGTILTFTHRGLGSDNAKGFIPGTHAYLDRLSAHLDGTELPDWAQRFAEVQSIYR